MGKKRPLKTVALAVKLWRKSLAKVKQPKVARVELRAGGGLYGPEKPGWSAGGKEKQLRNVKASSEVKQQQEATSQKPPGGSPKQVPSLGVLLSLQKSSKNMKRNLHKGKIAKVRGCLYTSVV